MRLINCGLNEKCSHIPFRSLNILKILGNKYFINVINISNVRIEEPAEVNATECNWL